MIARRTLDDLKRIMRSGNYRRERPPRMLADAREPVRKGVIFGFILAVLLICTLLYGWRSYLAQNYFVVDVSGSSMERTIQSGDIVYAHRSKAAERGDIVIVDVANYSNYNLGPGSHTIIKRLIAVEGDKIKCERGIVYLAKAGEAYAPLEEPYVYGGMHDDFDEVVLGEGEIFVMGDNRPDSKDSRVSGPFLRSDILGVVTDWSIEYRKAFTEWERVRESVSRFIETYVLLQDSE